MQRSAIITGITGQDGSYLADLLLTKGYKVYGFKRRRSDHGLGCASHLAREVEFIEGDIADLPSLVNVCRLARADEFYNLGAQSHVGTSFTQPQYTLEASGAGVLNCLEAIKQSGFHTRFYQAATSEMYGGLNPPQDGYSEDSLFYPRSPYGVAKLYGYWITRNYRESYKMFACSGILFNHESERRGPNFVTRKITMAVARIKAGLQDRLLLGNLDAMRDWGHAQDYVEGMWMMLNRGVAEDFVLCTGEAYSVKQFAFAAFKRAGLEFQQYVEIDPALYRPAEVNRLMGNPRKAREQLGWKPKISFEELVNRMVDSDIALLAKQKAA